MRFRVASVSAVVVCLAATLFAAVPVQLPSGIERLPNGNTLITDAGGATMPTARVLEVDSTGKLVWAYVRSDIPWAHTARRTPNGNTLISATNDNRVVEVNPAGGVAWEMTTGLSYPNEAWRLANGNTLITDRDNDRVIEVDSVRNVVWSYTSLLGPHNGTRLASGNTLICDSDRNKVVEVTPEGNIVWQYATGLSWGRCAQRLSTGNTLITDSRNNRVIEVAPAGTIVWSLSSGLSLPYMATRLANGNTLISTDSRVIEVDSSKSIVWQYPPAASAVAVETLWVTNPTSGCSLYVHIHRPLSAGPGSQMPAVVLIPRENNAGTVMDDNGLADEIASDGFAVLHFDADGRGRSGGVEDYDGDVQQDGLRACALVLSTRPYVDPAKLGIYTRGYGIVMATGMIARNDLPRVAFLLDCEGPADRYQCAESEGGHVPVPVDSEAFWVEREAARFIKRVPGAYLRIQTETDYTGRMPDNEHAIALIDSATALAHGGAGMCVWTRVNDSVMNAENRTYSVSDPPRWIPETEERNQVCREIIYLHELADMDFTAIGSGSSSIVHRSSLSVSPNPCRRSAVIRFSPQLQTANCKLVTIYDASGRAVLESPIAIRQSPFALDVRSVPAGVYIMRLDADNCVATTKLVVR